MAFHKTKVIYLSPDEQIRVRNLYRKDKELTVKSLAAKLDVSESVVSRCIPKHTIRAKSKQSS